MTAIQRFNKSLIQHANDEKTQSEILQGYEMIRSIEERTQSCLFYVGDQ
jgi:hypothetical protein